MHTADLHLLLKKYWGYPAFRPLQEEIMQTVLNRQDTLALLPTGGGKSLCYQVPALATDGICLVITPLVSLMKDQVENLKARGIRALSVHSGMSAREIDATLDNAVYGQYKFLYLSPERLETDIFKARAEKMKVSLLAVDEAHCVSEWGYDFRPAYLRIPEARALFPHVPLLALTATATPRVRTDILEKLQMAPEAQVFVQSFDRDNLVYGVVEEEAKLDKLVSTLQRVPGTAIVYAGSRSATQSVAAQLKQAGFSAEYYHAGLDHTQRSTRQEAWKQGRLRIIVATNAFGMGIDKPDVRLVAHWDMPDSLEAYYQEAGRAGRDGIRSFALVLTNPHDLAEMKFKAEGSQPSAEEVKAVYQALANYFQLPEGSGLEQSFDFYLAEFAKRFAMKPLKVHHALKALENAGYIQVSESVYMPARLMVRVDHHTLYAFEIANKAYEPLIKTLLRSYGGCFEEYVKISEGELARRTGQNIALVKKQLHDLQQHELIDYRPQTNAPQITYLQPRVSRDGLRLDARHLAERKQIYLEKLDAAMAYASLKGRCRGNYLLRYFGEESEERCGHCDYCLREKSISAAAAGNLETQILYALVSAPQTMDDLVSSLSGYSEKDIVPLLRRLIDEKRVRWNASGALEIA